MTKYPPELLTEIKACTNQAMVEQAFDGKNMSDEDKAGALLETMGNPTVFYSKGEISPERQYKALIGSFLSGIWKDDYSSYEFMRKKAKQKEAHAEV
jgi:hypothetical protein